MISTPYGSEIAITFLYKIGVYFNSLKNVTLTKRNPRRGGEGYMNIIKIRILVNTKVNEMCEFHAICD